ncbi:MAG: carbohydrate kinase family protein [Candidatus Hodarchaeales archaeon]
MDTENAIMQLSNVLTKTSSKRRLDCEKTLVALPDFFLDIFVSPGSFEKMVSDFKQTLSGKGRNIPANIGFKTGGNAWNTCYAAACLGVKSTFVGPLGPLGRFYTDKAIKEANNIELKISRSVADLTGDNVSICFEFTNPDTGAVQNVMISHDPVIKFYSSEKLSTEDITHLTSADIIAFSNWGANLDSNKLLKDVISYNTGSTVFFDPANLFQRATDFPELIDLLSQLGKRLILSMNKDEWNFLKPSIGERAEKCLKLAKVIIHDQDAVQLTVDEETITIPTFDLKIKFQTGLGDAFSGGYLAGYSAGLSDEVSILLGSAHAGFLGNKGHLPAVNELLEFLTTQKLRDEKRGE